jgi:hypothetical protein
MAVISMEVRLPPPSERRETIPPPRPGHVWIPGYWDWKGDRYAWISGHWEAERRGCHWVPHRWISRNGRWVLQAGGWAADDAVVASLSHA